MLDRDFASEILKAADCLGADCNKFDQLLRRITEEEVKSLFLKRLGVIADINITIILPIIREHPGLDPDR